MWWEGCYLVVLVQPPSGAGSWQTEDLLLGIFTVYNVWLGIINCTNIYLFLQCRASLSLAAGTIYAQRNIRSIL
jgi:hypothetical protein